MSTLISKAVFEINDPQLHVSTSMSNMGFKSATVSFDASKFPFQSKCGLLDKLIFLAGANFLSAREVELDALKRLVYCISSKFGVYFADCSY
jgi:hypothetical protein